MSCDLSRALRRLKSPKQTGPLDRRSDADLDFVPATPVAGPELLLDTTVYIDVLQKRAPAPVKDLLRLRANNHSALALAELLAAYGRLDPADPQTASVLASYDKLMAGIPAHRLAAPSVAVIAEAGILAGTLARLRSLPPGQAMLNDAIIYLQGLEQGVAVLTRNIGDFDRLQQLVPGGRVLFYRQQP